MRYRAIWLLILLLFAGDVATTIYGLQNGYEEGNPIVAEEMEDHGELTAMLLLLPLKIGVAITAMIGQWFAGFMGEPERQKCFPLMVLFILAAPPVVWNLWVLA
jgi:hypothetical protein